MRSAFANKPEFAKTSDADCQVYAEAMLLQAASLGSAFEQWKSDPAQLAEAARRGIMASGLDLSLMTLTPNGFIPRSHPRRPSAGLLAAIRIADTTLPLGMTL